MLLPLLCLGVWVGGQEPLRSLSAMDLFELEFATDPRVSPDGRRIAFVRNRLDVQSDRRRGRLWSIAADGTDLRPLTTLDEDAFLPRWSPDGGRIAYATREAEGALLKVRWIDEGVTARVVRLENAPAGLAWSPDGRRLAFTSLVPEADEPFVELPSPPEGAEWAPPPRVIRRFHYRADGEGYLGGGHVQLFGVDAEGGTPHQLTQGPFDVEGEPVWSPDGERLYFASNRRADRDQEPLDTELYALSPAGGALLALTDRRGPDESPAVSPDGRWIAYVGFDDRRLSYHVSRLALIPAVPEGSPSAPRVLTEGLDRSVRSPRWSPDGTRISFLFDDHGETRIGSVDLEGRLQTHAGQVGGTTIGRPYASGGFDVGPGGLLVYTRTTPWRPSDLALVEPGGTPVALTRLNEDVLGLRKLAPVEEFRFRSSFDDQELQGWIVRPPDFQADRRYPMILEIHGGPFANYGDRFSAEIQLYAASGYVVLYLNPRGSTGYGEEFANRIHHAYPGRDYDDLMSGVDACSKLGFVDPERLFVTGGSGGGVLASWTIGKTNRFRAAVVVKPVIHWTSFALTADAYGFFVKYWFPGPPWEHPGHYFERSPLSLVGNVETPTLLMTGEEDYRTPISEAEQYYQALKLRRVDAALVRVPEASHDIASRPSHLIAKVAHVLKWFELHGGLSGRGS